MTEDEIFAAVALERLTLADVFEALTPEQLATPSLCEGWTVKHVAAHLTMLFNVSTAGLLMRSLGENLSISRTIDGVTQDLARRPIEGIVNQLRDFAFDRRHMPRRPMAPLVDLIVHGEDVRRPLGLDHPLPFAWSRASMSFLTAGRAFGFVPSSRLRGLRFVATDGDGQWGQGVDVIHGPVLSLVLAIMGRRVALKDLGGPVQILTDRL